MVGEDYGESPMPTVKTNNVETCYETSGQGDPLVLIHGLGACHKMWQPQIEPFSEHFKVVAYDVRGHGESSGYDEKYSVGLFATDLKVLLDELGIGKAHICGLSMGGLIAQQFAIDCPSMVDRLVLCGTFCHLGIRRNLLMALTRVLNRIVLAFISMDTNARIGAKGLFKKKEQEELRDFFVREVSRISKKEYSKVIAATYAFDSLRWLREIESPTLILNAEGEKHERQQTEIMQREIRDSRVELIMDAFHATNLERPAEFNRLVLGFLRGELCFSRVSRVLES
jgi:3-oxoadipate enol-lactonase